MRKEKSSKDCSVDVLGIRYFDSRRREECSEELKFV